MSTNPNPVQCLTPVPGGRVHLFDAGGRFLRRITLVQTRELVSAELTKRRGDALRLIKLEGEIRRGLDGSRVHKSETDTNVRNCYAFRERLTLGGGS